MRRHWPQYLALALLVSLWGYYRFYFSKVQAGHQGPVLHLYAMSDYFPATVLEEFKSRFACDISYDNFSSNEELLAKLQAGATGYDVIVPSDYIVPALLAGKLLMNLDIAQLSNRAQLAPGFLELNFDPGGKFTVPYTWGSTGLVYNSKLLPLSRASWDALFLPEAAGHISLLDDAREVLGALLMRQGYSPNTVKLDELKGAQKQLLELKSKVRLFSSDPKQHLLSGDVWLAQIYSGDARQLMRDNPEMKFFAPQEGVLMFVDLLAIPRGASKPSLAHSFINFILKPEVAQQITEELQYSSPNRGVERLVADPTLRPSYLNALKEGRVEYLQDLGAKAELWDTLWTNAKSQ